MLVALGWAACSGLRSNFYITHSASAWINPANGGWKQALVTHSLGLGNVVRPARSVSLHCSRRSILTFIIPAVVRCRSLKLQALILARNASDNDGVPPHLFAHPHLNIFAHDRANSSRILSHLNAPAAHARPSSSYQILECNLPHASLRVRTSLADCTDVGSSRPPLGQSIWSMNPIGYGRVTIDRASSCQHMLSGQRDGPCTRPRCPLRIVRKIFKPTPPRKLAIPAPLRSHWCPHIFLLMSTRLLLGSQSLSHTMLRPPAPVVISPLPTSSGPIATIVSLSINLHAPLYVLHDLWNHCIFRAQRDARIGGTEEGSSNATSGEA